MSAVLAIALLLLLGQTFRTGEFGWAQLGMLVTAILLGAALRRRTVLPGLVGPPLDAVAETAPPSRTLEQQLDNVRNTYGAGRAVLWRIANGAERATPWLVRGGSFPVAIALPGDVLGWAAREGITVRQETAPAWAEIGSVACAVAPLRTAGSQSLLSLEFTSPRAIPDIGDLERAAAFLTSLIDLEHERGIGQAQRDKLNAVASMLKRLPEELDTERFAEQLALFGVQLTRATGAAVSAWEHDKGTVLAVATAGDGPRPGMVFTAGESETALAARGADTLLRADRPRASLPVVARAESFLVQPRTIVAIPLLVRGEVAGVLTLWTGERQFDDEALRWVETLAPYAALQLRHSRAYGQLRERADHDKLTALYNRQAFDGLLAAETARYQRYLHPFTLLLIDIDHFKSINDRYGHPSGDAVLANVGRVITRALREVDVAARYGGEEFAVLLPETELDIGQEIAERVRNAVANSSVHAPGGQITVTVSIGISACPACASDPDGLIRTADSALYLSKQNGRNVVTSAAVLN